MYVILHRLRNVWKRIVNQGLLFLTAVMLLWLSGCGSREEEIPIDFPFYETDDYSLALAAAEGDEYVLLFRDGDGQILQQIPCGKLKEPVTFSYDGIAYGSWTDLEIFSADSDTGLLFLWGDERFAEEPVLIPRYAEAREGAMLTVSESGDTQEKKIYQLNQFRNRVEEVRGWSLEQDSGILRIWDSLRRQCLFEGKIALDEEREPQNREYYEYLFWRGRDLLWHYSASSTVRVWEDSGAAEYEGRTAFLENCGYAGEAPFYQYYDRFQNLQLELYLDEEEQRYYGIAYIHRINSDLEPVVDMLGFAGHGIGEERWEEGQTFALPFAGDAGGAEEGYRETVEYTESGKPDHFLAQGMTDDCGVETLSNLVEIDFIYREDGTLFCRDYQHDARTFGSNLCGRDSFYDEKERLIYENGYLTHGSCEFYYVYAGEEEKPVYRLYLDYNGGYVFPELARLYDSGQ